MKCEESALVGGLLGFGLVITSYLLPLFPCFFSLELLADVQYAFGLPFYSAYQGQFSTEEQSLSLKVMQYFSNFIRSGYVAHCSPEPYHVFPPIPIPEYKGHIFFLTSQLTLATKAAILCYLFLVLASLFLTKQCVDKL
jgi:hypothetical protein